MHTYIKFISYITYKYIHTSFWQLFFTSSLFACAANSQCRTNNDPVAASIGRSADSEAAMIAAGWSWPEGNHNRYYGYCGNDDAFCAQFTASGSGTVRIKFQNAFKSGNVVLLLNDVIVSSAMAQEMVDELYSFEDGDVFRLEERGTAVMKIYPSMAFTCGGRNPITQQDKHITNQITTSIESTNKATATT